MDIILDKDTKEFVEIEDGKGNSISVGEWIETDDYWVIRISDEEIAKRIREKYLDVFTKDISFLRKDHEVFCIWLKELTQQEIKK